MSETKTKAMEMASWDTDPATRGKVIDSIVLRGDLSGLGPGERAKFYVQMCEGLGLNPTSQPFAFLRLNGKEILYATRGATDQLAAMHRVNREIIDGPKVIDLGGQKLVYCVAKATMPNGRTETAIATLPLADPANVLMKAETKAKRRVTMSILGLSLLDEMELETIPASAQEPGAGVDLTSAARRVDDAPQLPALSALTVWRLDLADVTDLRALTACWASHAAGLHDAGDSDTARLDASARMAAVCYALSADELGAVLRGVMHPALTDLHDALSGVTRHADDEDGDAVIADLVRALRTMPGLPVGAKDSSLTAAKRAALTAAVRRAKALGVTTTTAALTALLRPAPPPSGPSGGGEPAPTALPPSDASGAPVEGTPGMGAADGAAATVRVVLDTDTGHVEIAGTWRATAAGWREHVATMTARRRIEHSVACNGAALGPAFVALCAARIVELDDARREAAPRVVGSEGPLRLTVIGVTQTLERVALDASRSRAAAARQVAA